MAFSLGERRSWERHEGHVLASVDGYDAIRCEFCEFIHVIPLPSAENLTEYYATTFYEESKPDYFEKADEDREWLNIGYDMKLGMLEEALAPVTSNADSPRRVLDIGSGPGHFLHRAKERGWTAVGLEASPAAVEVSRRLGVEVHQGYFEGTSASAELGQFDAIHMQHVLEHAPDPHALLMGLFDRLKPGGIICVEVPNDFSVVQEILHTSLQFPAWWVAPPEHLNFFSQASLDSTLTRCGFDSLAWTSQFPIDLALMAGLNYIENPSLGREVHRRRAAFELTLSQTRPDQISSAGSMRRCSSMAWGQN